MKKPKFNCKNIFCQKTEKQLVKFLIVGIVTSFIYLLLVLTITEIFEIHYLLSVLFASLISGTINFLLNKTITFDERIARRFFKEYEVFLTIKAFIIPTDIIIVFALTALFDIHYLISSTISAGFTGNISFLANKFLNFKK